jgi:hypothetical protein
MAKKENNDAGEKTTKKDAALHKTKSPETKGSGAGKAAGKGKGKGSKKSKGDAAKQVVRMVPSTLGSHALNQLNVDRKYGDVTGSITRYLRLEVDKIVVASLFNKGDRKTVLEIDFEKTNGAPNTATARAAQLAIEAGKVETKRPSKPRTKKAATDAPAPKKKAAAPKKKKEEAGEAPEANGDDDDDDRELVDAADGEEEEVEMDEDEAKQEDVPVLADPMQV